MLGVSHRACCMVVMLLIGLVLHRVRLRLGDCHGLLHSVLVQEVVRDEGLPEGNRLIVVLGVDECLLDCVLNREFEIGFVN